MTILTPESKVPGAPVATANPTHQPRIPTEAGRLPFCSCGFVGGRKPGSLLADHLKAVDPTYGLRQN